MFRYYVFFLVLSLLFSSQVHSSWIWEYSGNAYVGHLMPTPTLPGGYTTGSFRANPPLMTTTNLLKAGFAATPAGALRTAVMGLAGTHAAGYVWNSVTEWWERDLNPPGPLGNSCEISLQPRTNVRLEDSAYSTWAAACEVIGGTVWVNGNAPATGYCQPVGSFVPIGSNNGQILNYADYPNENAVINECEQDYQDLVNNPPRVPLPDKDFADIIVNYSPDEIGVPLLNNIPGNVLERIITTIPQPGTTPQTRSPSTPISPGSSRNRVPVPTTNPTTGETTSVTEWPAFCTWATIVCEFIDWMTEPNPPPPDETIPSEEIGELETYNSGLSGGACPGGVSFSVGGQSMHYSMQPACDAMEWFRPLLLGMCTLIAGYILVGHKQG